MVGHWALDFTITPKARTAVQRSRRRPRRRLNQQRGRRCSECRTIAHSSPSHPLAAVALLAGCGSGGGGSSTGPIVLPARTFGLAGFEPHGPVRPGSARRVSFTIRHAVGQAAHPVQGVLRPACRRRPDRRPQRRQPRPVHRRRRRARRGRERAGRLSYAGPLPDRRRRLSEGHRARRPRSTSSSSNG